MSLLQKYTSPLWGIWKIEERWEELLALSAHPDRYLSTLNKYQSTGRKAEWLAVRLLLKELTGRETDIAYHPNGSPCLPDLPCRIAISHTKGYAAVLLHADRPVGIDIEYRSERIHRVKSYFLNEAEQKLLGNEATTTELLICWSAKETMFKMTGQKTVNWVNDIHILSGDFTMDSGFVTVREILTAQAATSRIRYHVQPDFVLTRSE
jgi:phosphopantetheinyl transferase